MKHVYSYELSDQQLTRLAALSNDSLPQGQKFFLHHDGTVSAIDNNLVPLFEAQNAAAIAAGEIAWIILEG